jgi:tetratricopeptide (TPR) repeat protein
MRLFRIIGGFALAGVLIATEAFAMLVPADPATVDTLALGNAAYDQRDWKRARRYYKQALKKPLLKTAALNNLAMVDLREGSDPKRAVQSVEDALINAKSARPYLLDTLAQFAIREGRYDDAQLLIKQIGAEKNLPFEFEEIHQVTRRKIADLVSPRPVAH